MRLYVYDDWNGQPIRPGYTVKGHPTIGIGRALDVHGISKDEALELCNHDIDAVQAEIALRLPWFAKLDDARQRVLCNLGFNVGVSGLLQFHDMLAAVEAGDYAKAAECLTRSKLASQAKGRVAQLCDLMVSVQA